MNETEYRKKLNSQIKEAYGKVVYTYTAHHKLSARLDNRKSRIKILQIILTAISTVGFFATIISSEILLSWVGGITAVVSLGLNLYTKDFNLQDDIKKHKDAADNLWDVRESYISLLVDFEALQIDEIRNRRDELQEMVSEINKKYPGTDRKSYKKSQYALQNEQEQTFIDGEVDELLPTELRNQ